MHHKIETPEPDETPGAALITGRAAALRPSVPLYRHMLYGNGLNHALDFLVLAHIHFMCEDGKQFTVDDLVTALRREGITSSNGKGLIGSKAVYESIARLRAVGFLHRAQDNDGGSFGKVAYTFYEFPATNPHWAPLQLSESAADAPLLLTGEAVCDLPHSNAISAGQAASPDKARADKARADRRTGKRRVSAGQTASPDRRSAKPSPPHPPEEEDSSSPNPLTDPARSLPSQREQQSGERAAEFAAEELRDASEFLQRMQRWQAGAATARRCAPKLLRAMRAQGWPALADMDDAHRALLEADILKNTGGAASWTKCLPGWVEDLRLYATVKPRTAPAAGGADEGARAALVAACPACDALGWVLDDDDDGPMVRCAHPGVSAGTGAA
ncbi:hypothetical protein [Streptomyces sp. NPDC006309]|uniref:hypothetical protein n=1 Tax=Streptomyces sp. NPDC006309 TaxID=3156749 RepID=UPI0033BB7439